MRCYFVFWYLGNTYEVFKSFLDNFGIIAYYTVKEPPLYSLILTLVLTLVPNPN